MCVCVCPCVPTVAPATSVTLQPGRETDLYVGQNFSWSCTVTFNSTLVDTPINISFSFNNTDPSNVTRIIPGAPRQINASTFQAETVYQVLAPSDMTRQPACSSNFTSTSHFITAVENPTEPISLTISGEPLHNGIGVGCYDP